MKKKIALLLAAAMVVGSLPMTAFASTDNNVSKVPSVEDDDYFTTSIVIDEFDGIVDEEEEQTIKLTLTNAEWWGGTTDNGEVKMFPSGTTFEDEDYGVTYTRLSDNQAMAVFRASETSKITLRLRCKATEEGEATVTIDDVDSVVSAETLKIANVMGGATTTTISDTTSIREVDTTIKNVVIEETTAGTLEKGELKLKLTNGFKYSYSAEPTVTVFPANGGEGGNLKVEFKEYDDDHQEAYFTVTGSSTTATTVSIGNITIYWDDDDAEVGDECEITVSNAGTTKETILVGTAADYGVNFTIYKDEELPVFYSGTYDEDVDTLTVKIKENIAQSWLTTRKTKIVFPEGVEVMGIDEDYTSNISGITYEIDENEVTLKATSTSTTGKAELRLYFQLSVSPDYTGEITATLTGSGVDEDIELTVGEAKFPVIIDADVNELMIDYRNTAASDIVITEVDAGALKKDTYVALQIDGIEFDGDPTVEVESGDMKIESVKTNSDGLLTFKIKTESQKEAATIRISDIELYMERSLPAGEYDLSVVALEEADDAVKVESGNVTYTGLSGENGLSEKDAIIRNYNDGDDDETGLFDIDEVTVLDGYVTIVTAGREQDDSTFTTKVTVTIGANTMMAGTKEIALDVPAYIANGYTMLPVRAVTEALSGSAIVRWDDASKTVTITFGQRVINMTVGSRTMVINGVNVAMQAACEITDSRAFIPLRDLGYALGLNDSKIAWDDATKTATLN